MRFISLFGFVFWSVMTSAATLADFQLIGSHNSYKRALPPSLLAYLNTHYPQLASQINYSHLPIIEQLDAGLRQLEIDVVNDPQGNQYSTPEMAGRLQEVWLSAGEQKALAAPGFKVLHIPHVDVLSDCISFRVCLERLKAWSERNPEHFPIMVMLNAKENQPEFIRSSAPEPFTEESYLALDAEISDVLGDKLITPDVIRGKHQSLSEAVRKDGWPAIEALPGKFIFLFDANPAQRNLYAANHASLRGRSMFASYPADSDEAAIMVRNDPFSQHEEIKRLVSQGFLVRTRADADFSASPEQMLSQFKQAVQSGAQFISTDFYPHSPQAQRTGYSVAFKHGALVRTNPFSH